MPSYRLVGKYIYRPSTQDVNMGGTRPDGSPNIVRQPGPMVRVEVGTILDDVTDGELAGAPDRFQLVTEGEKAQMAAVLQETGTLPSHWVPQRGVHEPVSAPSAVVQKPLLSAGEVAAAKAAEHELHEVDAKHAEQRAQLDKERQDAADKAMTETFQQEAQRQHQARSSATGRFQGSTPAAPPPAPAPEAPAPAPETPAEGGRRRP
jgi:hypothetical protein